MDITLTIRITDTDWKQSSSTAEREMRVEFPDDCNVLARMNFGAIAEDALKAAVAEYLLAHASAGAAVEAGAQS